MSRHEIGGRYPGDRIVLGWDQPLMTFFVHVFKVGSDIGDGPDVWLGGSLREIYDVDDLKRAIRPYAVLPEQLLAQLYGERDRGE